MNADKPKEYWAQINDLLNPKVNNTHFNLVLNDTPVPDPETADFINEFFATIGNKLAANMNVPWTSQTPRIDKHFTVRDCSEEDMVKLI